ncbi:MAG TPA: hypothetical protein GX723_09650 [Thermoanaerobacterales bacterium]|nr:hypothetical protein [Thermoanaerobacterales bacterium]
MSMDYRGIYKRSFLYSLKYRTFQIEHADSKKALKWESVHNGFRQIHVGHSTNAIKSRALKKTKGG